MINGEPRAKSWRSPTMQLVREDRGRVLTASGSPWLGSSALIFRSSIAERLRPLLESHGELLPLACKDADLVVFNATNVIDALDEGASSVMRLDGGKIMRVKRYVFRAERLQGAAVFKIPNLRVSPTFVSRAFIDAWEASQAVGLRFTQVWAPN